MRMIFAAAILLPGLVLGQPRFEPVGDVVFPDTLFLMGLSTLEVASNGDLLVVDGRGAQAFLFDSTGVILANLDPRPCHPGFELRPISAWFGPDFILMANSAPWGYRFHRDGACLGAVDDDYRPTLRGGVSPQGDIYSVRELPGQPAVLRRMDSTGALEVEKELFEPPFSGASGRFLGGGFVAAGESLYLAFATSASVYRLDLAGSVLEIWEEGREARRLPPPRKRPDRPG